jgi:hypothetical protein
MDRTVTTEQASGCAQGLSPAAEQQNAAWSDRYLAALERYKSLDPHSQEALTAVAGGLLDWAVGLPYRGYKPNGRQVSANRWGLGAERCVIRGLRSCLVTKGRRSLADRIGSEMADLIETARSLDCVCLAAQPDPKAEKRLAGTAQIQANTFARFLLGIGLERRPTMGRPGSAARGPQRPIADWVFATQGNGEVKASNDALCREYVGLDENDLLEISTRWRKMAVQFTDATRHTGHYHGHVVHDDEVLRVTKLLETAVSQRDIEGVSRLGRCLRRPDDDHLHWALATLDELDAKLRAESSNRILSERAGSQPAAALATTTQSTEAHVKKNDPLHADGLDRDEVMRAIKDFRRAVWEYKDSLHWVELLSQDLDGSNGGHGQRERAATRDACGSRNVNASMRAAEAFPIIMRQAEHLGLDVAHLQAAIARNPWEPGVLVDIENLVAQIEEYLTRSSKIQKRGPAKRGDGTGAVPRANSRAVAGIGGKLPATGKPIVAFVPVVELAGKGQSCKVMGKEKLALTDAQYDVIEALLKNGDSGLKKDSLERIRTGARAALKRLAGSDPDWKAVICFPARPGLGYRLCRPR